MTLDVRFQFISHWVFNNRELFQAVFWQKILPGITANFCSNNSDGENLGILYDLFDTWQG